MYIVHLRKIIAMSITYFTILAIDQPTVEWKCNICMSSIKFTIAQIAAHLLIVHKISIIFKCLICEDKYNNYEAFEQHFKFKHPSMELKYLNEHVDIVSTYSCMIKISINNILTSLLY